MLNVKKLFDEDLPAALALHEAETKSIGSKFQVDIEGAGSWFIDCTVPSCTPGNGEGAECTIKLYESDIEPLLEDSQNYGLKLFFAGRMRVLGNQILSARFGQVLGLAKPKAEA